MTLFQGTIRVGQDHSSGRHFIVSSYEGVIDVETEFLYLLAKEVHDDISFKSYKVEFEINILNVKKVKRD